MPEKLNPPYQEGNLIKWGRPTELPASVRSKLFMDGGEEEVYSGEKLEYAIPETLHGEHSFAVEIEVVEDISSPNRMTPHKIRSEAVKISIFHFFKYSDNNKQQTLQRNKNHHQPQPQPQALFHQLKQLNMAV